MANDVEEVKAKTDIVSLISEYIELKKAGRNYKALCPFHSEKTASFYVSGELQMFKCFGCGEYGDAITFLEKYEGMEFYEALKYLAEKAQVKLKPFKGDYDEKEKLYQINSWASNFYHWILLNHPKGKVALNYLLNERHLKIETIKAFKLGFSPDVPFAIEKFLVERKKVSVKTLERLGLVFLRGNQVFDRFRGRIIFPLFDHRSNIVGFAGRILPGREKENLAKYINTPETKIYHKSKLLYALNLTKADIKKSKSAIVVEGELDAISCWQVGVNNVVAIKGSAFTEDQLLLLGRFAENLVLAMDTDFAGDNAAMRGIELAQRLGFEVKVAHLGEFKDPDEAAHKDPKKLKSSIASARNVWDFIIDTFFKRYMGETGEQKGKISKELTPILAKIPDAIVQAHYISLVAKRLGVPQEAVAREVENQQDKTESVNPAVPKTLSKDRREVLEETLMSLAFRYKPKILLKKDIKKLFTTPLALRILNEFSGFNKRHKNFDPSLFAGKLPPELVDGFVKIILGEIKGVKEDDPDALKKEIEIVQKEIKILEVKQKLKKIASLIREIEEKGETEKLKELQNKFRRLTRELSKLEEEGFRSIIF